MPRPRPNGNGFPRARARTSRSNRRAESSRWQAIRTAVKGSIGYNSGKGNVVIDLADAKANGDIKPYKGKSFPKYKARGIDGTLRRADNQTTQTIKPVAHKGVPVIQYVITDSKGFPGKTCGAGDLRKQWRGPRFPRPFQVNGNTVTISQYTAPKGLELPPKGTGLYFAVNCFEATQSHKRQEPRRHGGVLYFCRQSTLLMPKTQHWQWYVEEFAPTEQHHHAIDEQLFSGRRRSNRLRSYDRRSSERCSSWTATPKARRPTKDLPRIAGSPRLASAAERSEVLILGGGEGATLREVLRCPDVDACHDG